MNFASYGYLLLLMVVVMLYPLCGGSLRKSYLLVVSYLFYALWGWSFCILLFASSCFNWLVGKRLRTGQAKAWLTIGISGNLLLLAYYKYFTFFTGISTSIAVPIGISFFTFEGISYLIDTYSGDDEAPTLPDYMLYVAFWPHLLAGPILRYSDISKQIQQPPALRADGLLQGGQQILYGVVKKVVFADNLAPFVDQVFAGAAQATWIDVSAGTLAFGLQIYFDFSGYSEIALGSARLFGFTFPKNFDWPYSASNFTEFWNRWHISLSSWIRDYLFGPLAYQRPKSQTWAALSLFLAMGACGLWHGANWTFILWGFWHGALLAVFHFWKAKKGTPRASVGSWILTMVLVNLGWIFFRSPNVSQAVDLFFKLATFSGGPRLGVLRENALVFIAFVAALIYGHGFLRHWSPKISIPMTWWKNPLARAVVYSFLIIIAIVFDRQSEAFVYFQF